MEIFLTSRIKIDIINESYEFNIELFMKAIQKAFKGYLKVINSVATDGTKPWQRWYILVAVITKEF